MILCIQIVKHANQRERNMILRLADSKISMKLTTLIAALALCISILIVVAPDKTGAYTQNSNYISKKGKIIVNKDGTRALVFKVRNIEHKRLPGSNSPYEVYGKVKRAKFYFGSYIEPAASIKQSKKRKWVIVKSDNHNIAPSFSGQTFNLKKKIKLKVSVDYRTYGFVNGVAGEKQAVRHTKVVTFKR